eukprot:gene5044-10104_t
MIFIGCLRFTFLFSVSFLSTCTSFAHEFGYLFDGLTDHLSFAVAPDVETSKEFTLQLWLRNEQKDKFGNLEQCIISQGSWEDRFKVSWTGLSTLMITLRNINGQVVDCHTIAKYSQARWYHLAFSFDARLDTHSTLLAYVNGIESPLTCTDENGKVFFGAKADNTLFTGPLPISTKLYTIASCYEGVSGPEARLFHGYISGVSVYNTILSIDDIRHSILNWKPSEHLKGHMVASHPLIVSDDGTPHSTHHDPAHTSSGVVSYGIHGEPVITALQLGETTFSVMRSVASVKVSIMESHKDLKPDNPDQVQILQGLFRSELGSLTVLTIDNKLVNERLVESLERHHRVALEERTLWKSYNEYSIRLEMLGHTVAAMTKSLSLYNPIISGEEEGGSHYIDMTLPVVAIVVPATSKGTQIQRVATLPMMRSLLPSLYRTMSRYCFVNAGDPIYSEPLITNALFDAAYEYWGNDGPYISHRLIIVPDTVVPKRALSALFNIPTLQAYSDGASFFYIVNDDLMLTSFQWTEAFVEKIMKNPLHPGLGVAGGEDTSDSVTPQIEFPFFHRTHVDIFPWCGANPWTFRNWWEDNWLTDIYLPFASVFYLEGVTVKNYVGIEKPSEGQSGSADPSYEVVEGRVTPSFYRTEVEKARLRILRMLNREHPTPHIDERAMDYCSRNGDAKSPTLALMPVAWNEIVLDPCNTFPEKVDWRMFQKTVHETEVPHVAYTEVLDRIENKKLEKLERFMIEREVISKCRPEVTRAEWKWKECQRAIGVDLLPAYLALPLLKGELCKTDAHYTIHENIQTVEDEGKKHFASCTLLRPLRVLILHNHCPLFTRYGSDKRLYHIAETLFGLGHTVSFGGMEVSGFETGDDHNRLKSIGAELY